MAFLSNKKILWGIVAILVVLNIGSLASLWLTRDRQPVLPVRHSRDMTPREHFLKNRLGFTPTQQAEFDSLLNKHRSALETKTEEIRALRENLMGMIRNQKFTEEAEQLVREIGEKQSELEMLNYRHFRDIMSICNEEQKEIFLQTVRRAVGPHHRRGDWPPDRGRDDDRWRGRRGR